jgi:fatty acid desaturase
LADLYVGDLVDKSPVAAVDQKTQEFVQEVRTLRQKYKEMGLFESNKMYYVFKLLSNFALLGLSLWILAHYGHNSLAVVVSGIICGLYFQQCGWLAHDVLHHQLFENRDVNRAWGYLVGNMCQGFSVAWWTDKHTTHHAVPNVHQEDPDIDTFPILAWSDHALTLFNELPEDVSARFFLKYQSFYFFPLLAFARVSWALQSILYSFDKTKTTMRNPLVEQVTLGIHYAWYFGVMYLYLDWKRALLWFLVSQTACGIMLALVFSLNHNGMPIFTKDEFKDMDFYSLQAITGRDVRSNLFSDWFTGGLNYQIEHHMFPTIPRQYVANSVD